MSVQSRDDIGLAVANSLAAIDAGAREVVCTVNGAGAGAGFTAIDEIVMAVAARGKDLGFETGVARDRLHRTGRLHAYLTGLEPQPRRVDIQSPATDASAPGTKPAPLETRYQGLGYALSPEELQRVAEDFAVLASRKDHVLDEDLISILHHGVMEDAPAVYRLTSFEVRSDDDQSEANVVITGDLDDAKSGVGVGDGPIAAVFEAMEGLTDFRVVLQDLTIRSATPGRDALGEVTIHASIDGQTFTGRGADTDVVRASALAYLHAVNKAHVARTLEEGHLTSLSDAWGV
jgi:2-isopropylmalate synthase